MKFDAVLDFVSREQARSAQVYPIERGRLSRLLGMESAEILSRARDARARLELSTRTLKMKRIADDF